MVMIARVVRVSLAETMSTGFRRSKEIGREMFDPQKSCGSWVGVCSPSGNVSFRGKTMFVIVYMSFCRRRALPA